MDFDNWSGLELQKKNTIFYNNYEIKITIRVVKVWLQIFNTFNTFPL